MSHPIDPRAGFADPDDPPFGAAVAFHLDRPGESSLRSNTVSETSGSPATSPILSPVADSVTAAVRGYQHAGLALLAGVDSTSRVQVRQARLTLVFAVVKARPSNDTRLFEGKPLEARSRPAGHRASVLRSGHPPR